MLKKWKQLNLQKFFYISGKWNFLTTSLKVLCIFQKKLAWSKNQKVFVSVFKHKRKRKKFLIISLIKKQNFLNWNTFLWLYKVFFSFYYIFFYTQPVFFSERTFFSKFTIKLLLVFFFFFKVLISFTRFLLQYFFIFTVRVLDIFVYMKKFIWKIYGFIQRFKNVFFSIVKIWIVNKILAWLKNCLNILKVIFSNAFLRSITLLFFLTKNNFFITYNSYNNSKFKY